MDLFWAVMTNVETIAIELYVFASEHCEIRHIWHYNSAADKWTQCGTSL